jgi:hypothetical protein
MRLVSATRGCSATGGRLGRWTSPSRKTGSGTCVVTYEDIERAGLEFLMVPALHAEADGLLKLGVFDFSEPLKLPIDSKVDGKTRKQRNIIPSRLVLALKFTGDGTLSKAKARWCARGDRDGRDIEAAERKTAMVTDQSFHFTLQLLAQRNWTGYTSDFPQAYLKGMDVSGKVMLEIPPLIRRAHSTFHPFAALSLRKGLYGLGDAGRLWEEKLVLELSQVGIYRSTFDSGLFLMRADDDGNIVQPPSEEDVLRQAATRGAYDLPSFEGEVVGILAAHVDDVLYGGERRFVEAVNGILERYEAEIEEVTEKGVTFLGRQVSLTADGYKVSMDSYIASIKPLDANEVVASKLQREELLARGQKYLAAQVKCPARGAIGQLLWVTGKLRWDALSSVCELARTVHTRGGDPEYCEQVNSIITLLKETPHQHVFRRVGAWKSGAPRLPSGVNAPDTFTTAEKPILVTIVDAAGGTPHRVGALQVLIGHEEGSDLETRLAEGIDLETYRYSSSVLSWISKSPKRVTASSSGAEVLGLMLGAGEALFTCRALQELSMVDNRQACLVCTDARNATSLNPPSERNLRVDWAALQATRLRKRIVLRHIPGIYNPADLLTKSLTSINVELFTELNSGLFRFSLEKSCLQQGKAYG